ncbi:MAG: hypothetical protein K940chlam7_01859 [Chlamydiae bacterium]|nr:hypothetical protein [Chlamydiota bacterium]
MKSRDNKSDNVASAEGAAQPFYKELFGRMEFIIATKAGVAAALSLYLGVSFAKFLNKPDYLLSGTWSVMSTFVVMPSASRGNLSCGMGALSWGPHRIYYGKLFYKHLWIERLHLRH